MERNTLFLLAGVGVVLAGLYANSQPQESDMPPGVPMPGDAPSADVPGDTGMSGLGSVYGWRNFGQFVVEINAFRYNSQSRQWQHIGNSSQLNALLRPPRRVNGYAVEQSGSTYGTPDQIGHIVIRGSVYTNASNPSSAAASELRNALYYAGYSVRRYWFAPANAMLNL